MISIVDIINVLPNKTHVIGELVRIRLTNTTQCCVLCQPHKNQSDFELIRHIISGSSEVIYGFKRTPVITGTNETP